MCVAAWVGLVVVQLVGGWLCWLELLGVGYCNVCLGVHNGG